MRAASRQGLCFDGTRLQLIAETVAWDRRLSRNATHRSVGELTGAARPGGGDAAVPIRAPVSHP